MNRQRTVAALLFLVGALALPPPAFPSDAVKIVGFGLQGYYSQGNLTVVRVLVIHADSQPAAFELRVHLRGQINGRTERTDTFTQNARLGANEQRIVDVPVVLFRGGMKGEVEVEAADERGQLIGKDSIPLTLNYYPPGLIALLCADQQVCQEVQSQISFSGTPSEQDGKSKQLKFVTLQNAPEEWWSYAPARTVVLAAPLSRMPQAQRTALEEFVRHRGTLIVIQDKVVDPEFLAPYRTATSAGSPSVVGQGKVFWIPSLASKKLGNLYVSAPLIRMMEAWRSVSFRNSEMDWVRRRLAHHFKFPTLTWLLCWLAAYILIAGVGNFVLLRWMDRREWGWVTLPCLSLLFALGMYFSSASNRPREFLAEDVAFYWMDENSPVASVERGERISAPRGGTVDFALSGNMILAGDRNATGDALSVNPFDNGSPDQAANHWDVRIGPPVSVKLPMLQWSFRDLEFDGTEREPGTVGSTAANQLHNGTGKNFTQALYVDKDTVYFLGGIAAGADVNLAAATQKPLDQVIGKQAFTMFGYPSELAEADLGAASVASLSLQLSGKESQVTQDDRGTSLNAGDFSARPFDLTELIRGWPRRGNHAFDLRSGIFFGLADEPNPPVSLSVAPFTRKGHSVTVVSFERKP